MNPRNWLKKRWRGLQLSWLAHDATPRSPRQWVFITGCYNSGTTLLHDVLASHPDVAHLPREGQYCTDQLLVPKDAGLARAWALQPERFTLDEHSPAGPDPLRVQRQWSALMRPAQRPVFLEKSIPNAARIRWLNAHFAPARFVAIVRNGYAVAEGIRRKAGLPLDQAARQWRRSNEIMLRDLQQVEQSVLVSYEDFTAAPAETLDRICAFLGLAVDQRLADKRQWEVHGVVSSIKNMNPPSIDRLTPDERDLIRREAGDMLARFGYTD